MKRQEMYEEPLMEVFALDGEDVVRTSDPLNVTNKGDNSTDIDGSGTGIEW